MCDLLCVQPASYLERGSRIWMMPPHLHVNKKSEYDDDCDMISPHPRGQGCVRAKHLLACYCMLHSLLIWYQTWPYSEKVDFIQTNVNPAAGPLLAPGRAGPRGIVLGRGHWKRKAWIERHKPRAGEEHERGYKPPSLFLKKNLSLKMHFKPFWSPFSLNYNLNFE